jgi:hypothetical protein
MLTNPLDLLCFVENLTEPETKKLTEIIQTIIDANEKTGVVIYQDGCILIASKFARKVIHEEDIQDFMHTNFFLSQTKEVKEQLLTNIFSLSEETYYITLNIDDYQIRFKTTPKIRRKQKTNNEPPKKPSSIYQIGIAKTDSTFEIYSADDSLLLEFHPGNCDSAELALLNYIYEVAAEWRQSPNHPAQRITSSPSTTTKRSIADH